MERRWRGVVAAAAIVGASAFVAGRGRAGDVARGPDGRPGDFVRAGRFTVNIARIDYVERGERGQLYVYFTSKNSIVVAGDDADALVRALDPGRPR
jgi:hypothetical protein